MKEKKEKVLSFKVEPQHKKKLEVLAHETRRSQSARGWGPAMSQDESSDFRCPSGLPRARYPAIG